MCIRDSFRASLPLNEANKGNSAAADGQMGCIMKIYREWQLSGDNDFLKNNWGQIKKEMCIRDRNGSADGDGNEYANDVAVQSWFGRLNYDYQGKYLFEASLRADGSSRFAKNHRWGVFPSFSAGWNLHRESFMIETNNWLSELKIRASWGVLGDAEMCIRDSLSADGTYHGVRSRIGHL